MRVQRRAVIGGRRPVIANSAADEEEVELESICARLNKIIEHSDRIDRRLAEIEQKEGKNVPKHTVIDSKPSVIPSERPRRKIPPRQAAWSVLERAPPAPQPKPKPAPASSKLITIADLYELILDLKEEVGRMSASQREIKEEVAKLKTALKR
jgi:hypothetical protein